MRINLKISHKGLILVSVPLIFELAFVVLLVHMLNQADQVARREARSKQIVAEASELSKAIIDAGFSLITWQYYRNKPDLLKRYAQEVGEVPGILQRLDTLTSNNARQREHVNKLRLYATSVLSLFERYGRRPIDLSGVIPSLISINDFRQQMELTYAPLLSEAKLLAGEEQEAQRVDPDAEERSKSAVRTLIMVGVIFNILLTIAMALFFSRSITRRLGLLGDNALRLAKKEPLHEPFRGSDEIASLDQVFRQMASDLSDSDQRKQEFVNMITHDLRTPLSSIQGNLSLVTEGHYGELSEKAQERLTIAEKNVTRLINLINELLDIERIEAGMLNLNRGNASLLSLIEEAVVSIRDFAEQKKISIVVPNTDQEIFVDSVRIVQVLVNILSNSIKFSPSEGQITIKFESKQNSVSISIVDQGPGIAPEDLDRVFDRFQQAQSSTKTKFVGSGLGLAICKAIIEAHQGRIGVSSVLNQGSTFWFELPVDKSNA